MLPLTGDLFATAAPARVPAATPCTAVAPIPPAASRSPALGNRRTTTLWYAVVFPGAIDGSLERLARVAQQFTSRVSIEPPDALLLEVRGSVRLFGSLERLLADLDAAWHRLPLEASSSVAPSTLGALWLARGASAARVESSAALAAALAALPIRVTAWPEETLQTLSAMGVNRLGELLRLPRAGIARRFGAAALRDLDVALERQPAPRRSIVPIERFRERHDGEYEIETVAGLLEPLEPMVVRCAQFLRQRQAGVQALELRLKHRDRASSRVRLGLASITSDRRRLYDTVVHTLTRLELAAPVRSFELRSGPLRPLMAGSLDVFSSSRTSGGGDTAAQLIERLRARLGERSVYGLRTIAEHRPEAAWQRNETLEVDTLRPIPRARRRTPSIEREPRGGLRPLWLLEEPRPLSDADPPRSARGDLTLELGPERIESGWWDGADITRDYYRAFEPGGVRLWVFRDLKSGRWYLHGVFA